MKKIAKFIFISLFCCNIAQASESVRVIDGDGLEVNGIIYRLWGIDAPELDQTCSRKEISFQCGRIAKAVLETTIGSSIPNCQTVTTDRYKRVIAKCYVDGVDLASIMVNYGWALDYEKYSKGAYRFEQNVAMSEARGLWGGNFIVPWKWRKSGI